MYLNLLSYEHKHVFRELEIYLALSDEGLDEKEKNIIKAHCLEMHIDHNDYKCEMPIELIKDIIRNEFTEIEKRAAFIEVIAVIMADGLYHDKEKELMLSLRTDFGISKEQEEWIIGLIELYNSFFEKSSEFVNKGKLI